MDLPNNRMTIRVGDIPIQIGDCFNEAVLLQWQVPPKNDTNPWPLQLWCVKLKIVGASWGGTEWGVLYPGCSAQLIMSGTGLDLVNTAMGLITAPTMLVGLRGPRHDSWEYDW